MKRSSASGINCRAAVGVIVWTLEAGLGWLARYLKEVDKNETTIRFWQEIYDDQGKLIEIHEKYPVDKGRQKV